MKEIPFDPYDFFGYIASGLLVIVGMQLVFGFPVVLGKDLKAFDLAALILAIYVAGQIVAGPAKAFLEDFVVDKLLKRPAINLFRRHKPRIRGFLFPGYYHPLPTPIQDDIAAKFREQNKHFPQGEHLFLAIRYSQDVRMDPELLKRLDSFRDKYGFNRNLAFTSLLVGTALLLKHHFAPEEKFFQYSIASFVIGLLLFYRYLKFFRQYSYELFNCYRVRIRSSSTT